MKILKIPFVSKPKAKTKSKGFAKYLFDEENGEILEQRCELLEGSEFRGKNINKFSKQYYGLKFDKNCIKFRKKIMENDLKTEVLDKEKIEIVNKYFFENLTTFFNFDKYITGSNPTGSDFNIIRSPYIIFGGKYNQFLFINFFKKYTKKSRLKTDLRKSGIFEEIDLEKYFLLFPEIKKDFENFNKILSSALYSENEEENNLLDNSDEKEDLVKLITDKNYMIGENLKDEEINKKRISILRRIFKNRLRKIKPSDHLLGELPEEMCEGAHIFPVSEIKKLDLEYWYMIADENNGLSLPTQFHKLYDKHKIYFDENGKIIYTNEKFKEDFQKIFPKKEFKILENIINNKRKTYIKMYNKKFFS